jgi:hypothetical protein
MVTPPLPRTREVGERERMMFAISWWVKAFSRLPAPDSA